MFEIEETYATLHSIKRADERLNIKNKKELDRWIMLAYTRGKRAHEMKRRRERNYLTSRCTNGADVVAYDGFCAIFNERGGCISMYPLPKHFGKAYSTGKPKINMRGIDPSEYELCA